MQAPFFIIDAPKPVTESRIGSGHPGKPIFVSCVGRSKSVARGFEFAAILGKPLKAQRLDKKVTGNQAFLIVEPTKSHRNLPEFLHSLGAGGGGG